MGHSVCPRRRLAGSASAPHEKAPGSDEPGALSSPIDTLHVEQVAHQLHGGKPWPLGARFSRL